MHREELVALRRELHRNPETAFREHRTAERIGRILGELGPSKMVGGLGGTGIAAVFDSGVSGETILLRCELDALPIPEGAGPEHASAHEGVSHKCGHDGHMAMLVGVAARLADRPPEAGSVILLFQPAEETGEGAARVMEDPLFAALNPDTVFALHNLPGFPAGSVICGPGAFAAGSKGLIVSLEGATAHAAEPHLGNTPTPAAARLMQELPDLPGRILSEGETGLITIIHVKVGERAFGTTPGDAVVMATLRSHDKDVLERLSEASLRTAGDAAAAGGLRLACRWTEVFPPTVNDLDAVALVAQTAGRLGLETICPEVPFGWSEDFGHFTGRWAGALIGLGAGEDHPALHHPDYDFPDCILETGVDLLEALVRER